MKGYLYNEEICETDYQYDHDCPTLYKTIYLPEHNISFNHRNGELQVFSCSYLNIKDVCVKEVTLSPLLVEKIVHIHQLNKQINQEITVIIDEVNDLLSTRLR